MQRTAQDWLVLTTLTRHSGMATGITVGLQFMPLLLFSPYVGVLADRRSKRRILACGQSLLGLRTPVLSLLVMTHTVRLWEVYLCALGVGFGGALDNPARQALVPEIVPRTAVPSAVGLLGATQNMARMVGPAGAGMLIAAWGTGPCLRGQRGGLRAAAGPRRAAPGRDVPRRAFGLRRHGAGGLPLRSRPARSHRDLGLHERWSVLTGGLACIGAAAVCLAGTWWLRPAPHLVGQERLAAQAGQRAS
jgi:MFS family permease